MMIVVALIGAILISVNVVTITRMFSLSENQDKAHKHIMFSKTAARFIGESVKFLLLKKKFYIEKVKNQPSLVQTSIYLKMVLQQHERRQLIKDDLKRPTMYTILMSNPKIADFVIK